MPSGITLSATLLEHKSMDAKLVEAWHLDAAASKGGGAKHGGSAAKAGARSALELAGA